MQRRRLDWWIWSALVLAIVEAGLFLIPQTRPGGLLPVLCWHFGSSRLLWPMVSSILLMCGILWSVRRRPFWNVERLAGYVLLLGLAASPLAFRVYPSSHDETSSSVAFRLPFDGPVTVGWGGVTPSQNHHVIASDQRWAYDLAVTKDGRSFRGDGESLSDYYSYGVPVLAPAAATVYALSDGAPDLPIGALYDGKNVCGNQVVLEVAPNQFLFLCHLLQGSIVVKVGDHVTRGQTIGRVGNSGNSSEPHLHLHLQDGPKLHAAEAIPLYFNQYRVGEQLIERGMPTGGTARQIVENAEKGTDPNRK